MKPKHKEILDKLSEEYGIFTFNNVIEWKEFLTWAYMDAEAALKAEKDAKKIDKATKLFNKIKNYLDWINKTLDEEVLD